MALKSPAGRNKGICEKIKEGQTFQEMADEFGVTKQRIHQIFRELNPHHFIGEFGGGKKYLKTILTRQGYNMDKLKAKDRIRLCDLAAAQSLFFSNKARNSRHTKWGWSITRDDLFWPSHCPVLGIEINWSAGYRAENSPSIDRLNSDLGYIPGNVVIMSWRANRIKNNGTAEEHRKIWEYLSSRKEPSTQNTPLVTVASQVQSMLQ